MWVAHTHPSDIGVGVCRSPVRSDCLRDSSQSECVRTTRCPAPVHTAQSATPGRSVVSLDSASAASWESSQRPAPSHNDQLTTQARRTASRPLSRLTTAAGTTGGNGGLPRTRQTSMTTIATHTTNEHHHRNSEERHKEPTLTAASRVPVRSLVRPAHSNHRFAKSPGVNTLKTRTRRAGQSNRGCRFGRPATTGRARTP